MILQTKQGRSSYTTEVRGQFILITDHASGMSVTNNAENVIIDVNEALLQAGLKSIDRYTVLYMDTIGQVDALLTKNNQFDDFEFVGAETFEEAIKKLSHA